MHPRPEARHSSGSRRSGLARRAPSRARRAPRVGSAPRLRLASSAPPPISALVTPALPGEGQWRGTGPLVGGAAPVLVATFRPDPNYPHLVGGVAGIGHTR